MEVSAYAKINLFLDVQSKRADGYHNIVSIMQSIDWHDTLHILLTEEQGVHLSCTEPLIPTNEKNTAYKAATLFLQQIDYRGGVTIHIEKRIPHEAGLAGGSADAAATLKGLNQLFEAPLSQQELLALGVKIGADVPFCLQGGTRLVTGIGEKLQPFFDMPNCYLVCAKPNEGISTPAAYGELDRRYSDFNCYSGHTQQLDALRSSFQNRRLSDISLGLYNIFEEPVSDHCPAVGALKRHLESHGAIGTLMSGSGPSVFGIFEERKNAETAYRDLNRRGVLCRVCKPIQTI